MAIPALTYFHYDHAGLRVRSEFPVADWDRYERVQPFEDPDVVIGTGADIPQALVPRVSATEYVFRIPGVGTYSVRDGREIAVFAEPGADDREVRLFLLGTAWSAVCYQRGLLLLHAGVVQSGDGAIAFCGKSGAGKSSACAWLLGRGWRLLGDDLCRFETASDAAVVYPSPPRLKLWREALEAMSWPADGLEQDHSRLEKYRSSLPEIQGPSGFEPVPVRAIYLLEWGDLDLTRLTGVEALRRFVAAATYRPDLIDGMGRHAIHWELFLELARRTTVWQFTRPRDWEAADEAMESLLVHARQACGEGA